MHPDRNHIGHWRVFDESNRAAFQHDRFGGIRQLSLWIQKNARSRLIQPIGRLIQSFDRASGVGPIDGDGPELRKKRMLFELHLVHDRQQFLMKISVVEQKRGQRVEPIMMIQHIQGALSRSGMIVGSDVYSGECSPIQPARVPREKPNQESGFIHAVNYVYLTAAP